MTNFLTNALIEIAARNELRRDVDLPMLNTITELRKMKQAKDAAALDAFELSPQGAVIKAQVLQERREVFGANWKPNWATGMSMQNEIRRRLRAAMKRS